VCRWLRRGAGYDALRGHPGDPPCRFCAAMAGTWLGFLGPNRHPARMFMGGHWLPWRWGGPLQRRGPAQRQLGPCWLWAACFRWPNLSSGDPEVVVFKAPRGGWSGRDLLRMAHSHTTVRSWPGHSEANGWWVGFWDDSLLLVAIGLCCFPEVEVAAGASGASLDAWLQVSVMLISLERKGADGRFAPARGRCFPRL